MSSSGRNHITELDKKIKAISNDDTFSVFKYICDEKCHRNKECRNHIGSGKTTEEALKSVNDFKLHLWTSAYKSGRDHRNLNLMYDLFRMQNPSNRELFNFTIGYDLVYTSICLYHLLLLIFYTSNLMFFLFIDSSVQRLL